MQAFGAGAVVGDALAADQESGAVATELVIAAPVLRAVQEAGGTCGIALDLLSREVVSSGLRFWNSRQRRMEDANEDDCYQRLHDAKSPKVKRRREPSLITRPSSTMISRYMAYHHCD
jgi:hypothetical protein